MRFLTPRRCYFSASAESAFRFSALVAEHVRARVRSRRSQARENACGFGVSRADKPGPTDRFTKLGRQNQSRAGGTVRTKLPQTIALVVSAVSAACSAAEDRVTAETGGAAGFGGSIEAAGRSGVGGASGVSTAPRAGGAIGAGATTTHWLVKHRSATLPAGTQLTLELNRPLTMTNQPAPAPAIEASAPNSGGK